jgi:hypothetical protein
MKVDESTTLLANLPSKQCSLLFLFLHIVCENGLIAYKFEDREFTRTGGRGQRVKPNDLGKFAHVAKEQPGLCCYDTQGKACKVA